MNTKLLIGLVVLTAGVGIGWYVLGQKPTTTYPAPIAYPTAEASPTAVSNTPSVSPTGASTEKVVVTYTDKGFTPKTVTIKVGTTVQFMNQSASSMWVASALHPTHQLLPGFDQLQGAPNGGVYTYTFVKVGTWKYHNHLNPSDMGVVVVTE